VGNEVHTNHFAKPGIRSAFDYDTIVTVDIMEHILDYTFTKLGISDYEAPSIEHPLVMTEALGNPPNSRRRTYLVGKANVQSDK
jgi:actin-related protein